MNSTIVSKAEFATLSNVAPSRVSHWIKEGKISGNALVGKGPRARIVVDEARRQLRIKIDPTQRTGNGLKTRLGRPKPVEPVNAPEPARAPAPLDAVAVSVWLHTRELPAVTVFSIMNCGGTPRQAYLVYRAMIGAIRCNFSLAFGMDVPGEFDPIGLDLAPGDVARWNAEWDRQFEEDEAA